MAPAGWLQVRVASCVCTYWRAAAQDVLLADTAVSKPERCGFLAQALRALPSSLSLRLPACSVRQGFLNSGKTGSSM